MKKLFGAALLTLPLLAGTASAGCFSACFCCSPYKIDAGANFHFKLTQSGGPQLGPWYQYWPMEAHFQTPALCNYPYWPPPQMLPDQAKALGAPAPDPAMMGAPAPMPTPTAGNPAAFDTSGVQPTGYSPQTPGYWYNR